MASMKRIYSSKFDSDDQISMEEQLAALLYDHPDLDISEELAQALSQQLLKEVLWKFRPDLFKKESGT